MAQINGQQAMEVAKSILAISAVIMIAVAVIRAFGINVPYFQIGNLDLAAIASAAAFISSR